MSGIDLIIVYLYVDDLLVTGNNNSEMQKFKGKTHSKFEMTDLGTLTYFLGLEFLYTDGGIITSEQVYTGSAQKVSDAEL